MAACGAAVECSGVRGGGGGSRRGWERWWPWEGRNRNGNGRGRALLLMTLTRGDTTRSFIYSYLKLRRRMKSGELWAANERRRRGKCGTSVAPAFAATYRIVAYPPLNSLFISNFHHTQI